MSQIQKVFMDTNIIGGLAKQDFETSLVDGILEALQLRKKGKIELWVSDTINQEIQKIPEEYRYYHYLIYSLLNDLPIKKQQTSTALNLILHGAPFSSKDPILKKLERIIPSKKNAKKQSARDMDINHLFQCTKNNCLYFWTEDRRSILHHREKLEQEIGVKVVSTFELIREIN